MIELAQDIIVTMVAASATVVVGRRLVGAVRPAKGQQQPACPSCASGAAACAKPRAQQQSENVHPLRIARKS